MNILYEHTLLNKSFGTSFCDAIYVFCVHSMNFFKSLAASLTFSDKSFKKKN